MSSPISQSCVSQSSFYLWCLTQNPKCQNWKELERSVKSKGSPDFTDTETRALSPKVCCVGFKTNRVHSLSLKLPQADGQTTEAAVFHQPVRQAQYFSTIFKRKSGESKLPPTFSSCTSGSPQMRQAAQTWVKRVFLIRSLLWFHQHLFKVHCL